MSTAAAGDDRSIGNKGVVNTWERHEISLEFVQVNVKGAIETQASGKRANNSGDETVEVIITRAGDVKLALTDIVDGLVVNEESAVRVLNSTLCGQHSIIGFHHGSGYTRRRVDRELQLRLLAILCEKMLKQKCTEARAGTSAKGVEYQETLKRRAVIFEKISLQTWTQRRVHFTHRRHDGCGQQRFQ